MTECSFYKVIYYSDDDRRHEMLFATMASDDSIEGTLRGVQDWLNSQGIPGMILGILRLPDEAGCIFQDASS